MAEQKNAHKLMEQAIDKAANTVKGGNFPQTVLDEFDAKIDQASELASVKFKQNK